MDVIQLTIRSSKGQTRVSVPVSGTLGDLKAAIEAAVGVPAARQTLLFPPATPITGADSDALAKLQIKGGALVLREADGGAATAVAAVTPHAATPTVAAPQPATTTTAAAGASSAPATAAKKGKMVRRVVDADNSCLFTSFSYLLEGKTRSKPQQMRQIVADVLARNEMLYTEAFLNKSNAEYRKWILLPGAWGGAIEIAILSEHYRCEVASFDIQTNRVDLYGEGNRYTRRVYLIYDGLHYDPMAWADADEKSPEAADTVIFAPDDAWPLVSGQTFCKQMHDQHAFTDTSKFSLRCGVCGKGLEGEDAAMKHAQSTKPPHTNFQEFMK